ncbi:MAG: spore germination protein GerW family protein [Nitrososphaeria archaeon]|jgi:uncharacterized spore protein YtfJ
MSAEENIKTMVEELLKLLATKNVVGEPMEFEDKIIIPLKKFGVGFGAGSGEGKGERGEGGKGSGGGGGTGVVPTSIIVIFKGVPGPEGIKVMNISTPGPIGKMIGEIATSMMDKMKESKKEEEHKKE